MASIQNAGQWVKKHPVLVLFLILLLFLGVNIYHAYLGNPLKVTDPSSPKFKIENFRLLDYSPKNLNDALVKIFPQGTDRSFVDSVMRSAGGSLTHTNEKEIARYEFPKNLRNWYDNPFLVFIFDEQNKLVNIKPQGSNRLYKNVSTIGAESGGE